MTKALAVATAVVFFALVVLGLYFAHPAEDAFILFKYVDNFVAGQGIVYYVGGPRTEGATDFLWFVAVSILTAMKLDVAVAAAAGNAMSAGIIAFVLMRQIEAGGWSRRTKALLQLFIAGATLFIGGAGAAYLGFGSMFFIAGILLLHWRLVDPQRRDFIAAPLLAITVALIRPDGVVIAFGYQLIALFLAIRRGAFRPFLASSAAAVVIGLIYFVWRYNYFGLLLPLPLYVKGHGSEALPGLSGHFDWLKSTSGPVLIALLLITLAIAALRQRGDENAPRARDQAAINLALLFPAAMHLGILLFAHHYQNNGYRFQAPAYMAMLFCVIALAGILAARVPPSRQPLLAAALIVCIAPAFAGGVRNYLRWTSIHFYVDAFSYDLAGLLSHDNTFVLTEAGRLAYWNNARVIDVVGLNDPHAAVRPVDLEYLSSLKPDMIMFSTGGSVQPMSDSRETLLLIDGKQLIGFVSPRFNDVLESRDADLASAFKRHEATALAPVVLCKFLAEQAGEYDVYLLHTPVEDTQWGNIFAFRKTLPTREKIVERLKLSYDLSTFEPYARLKNFPFATRRATEAGTPAPRSAHARP